MTTGPGTVFFTFLLILVFFVIYLVVGAVTTLSRIFSTHRRLRFKYFSIFYSIFTFFVAYIAVTNSVSWTQVVTPSSDGGFWSFLLKATVLVIFGSVNTIVSFLAFLVLQVFGAFLLFRIFSYNKDHEDKKQNVIEGEIVD